MGSTHSSTRASSHHGTSTTLGRPAAAADQESGPQRGAPACQAAEQSPYALNRVACRSRLLLPRVGDYSVRLDHFRLAAHSDGIRQQSRIVRRSAGRGSAVTSRFIGSNFLERVCSHGPIGGKRIYQHEPRPSSDPRVWSETANRAETD